MIMRKCLALFASMLLFASCGHKISVVGQYDCQPDIFPDYKDVTIPCNISPMNFEFMGNGPSRLLLLAGDDTLTIKPQRGVYSFGERFWRRLLAAHKGSELKFILCDKTEDGWRAYKEFAMAVSEDEIDPYLAYRLITPGYSLWKDMSICQRDLESFREKVIYSNRQGKGNCVNCHSFCDRDPEHMLFHMRSELAGTYIIRNGVKEKLDTKTDSTMSALVYPYWHPSGKYVAFSVNKTNQVLHSMNPDRIEVFDEDSDVVVYDVENHEIITSSGLSAKGAFETFPTFSPDGRSLYFCSSKAVSPMPEKYREARYNLCRVDFDPDACTFGAVVDTLTNAAATGKSVSYPRVSPDGKYLVYALSDYGNFSIWHKEADLYMLDLENGNVACMDALNSDDVESYHSWSGNSRWLAFSSRRDDGLYTKPFFAYVDADGQPRKAFLLPQKNPRKFYDSQMFSYNIPELVSGDVNYGGNQIASFANDADGKKVGYKMK